MIYAVPSFYQLSYKHGDVEIKQNMIWIKWQESKPNDSFHLFVGIAVKMTTISSLCNYESVDLFVGF